jgi:hypothetical protein
LYLRAGCSLAASPKLRPGLFLCLTQTHDNARRGNAACLLANQSGEAVRRSAMLCARIFRSVALGNSVNVQGNSRTAIHNARVAAAARPSFATIGVDDRLWPTANLSRTPAGLSPPASPRRGPQPAAFSSVRTTRVNARERRGIGQTRDQAHAVTIALQAEGDSRHI